MTVFQPDRLPERKRLVTILEREEAIISPEVRNAFLEVPRHLFLPEEHQELAYANQAVPLGRGQTISQPLMVAVMTELLDPAPGMTLLEIGTGSGYQSAILSRLVERVHTVERIVDLGLQANSRFEKLGYTNIRCHEGDGTLGYEEFAPYDGIVVTAGAPQIPFRLKEQLKDGASLIIPVGGSGYQVLKRIRRNGDSFEEQEHGGCVFVKLIGEEGWRGETGR